MLDETIVLKNVPLIQEENFAKEYSSYEITNQSRKMSRIGS